MEVASSYLSAPYQEMNVKRKTKEIIQYDNNNNNNNNNNNINNKIL